MIKFLPIIGAVVLATSASHAAPCHLTKRDFAGLAISRSAVKTQAQFDALSPDLQHIACMTRAFYSKVHAQHDCIASVDNHNPDYLSAAENAEVVKAVHALFYKELYNKPVSCGG